MLTPSRVELRLLTFTDQALHCEGAADDGIGRGFMHASGGVGAGIDASQVATGGYGTIRFVCGGIAHQNPRKIQRPIAAVADIRPNRCRGELWPCSCPATAAHPECWRSDLATADAPAVVQQCRLYALRKVAPGITMMAMSSSGLKVVSAALRFAFVAAASLPLATTVTQQRVPPLLKKPSTAWTNPVLCFGLGSCDKVTEPARKLAKGGTQLRCAVLLLRQQSNRRRNAHPLWCWDMGKVGL